MPRWKPNALTFGAALRAEPLPIALPGRPRRKNLQNSTIERMKTAIPFLHSASYENPDRGAEKISKTRRAN
jgi:hypothetical protein